MIAMKAATLRMLRDELCSLRHPGNEERRLTFNRLIGMLHALLCEEAITHQQHKMLGDLAVNASNHGIYCKPWPAGEWYPF